MGNWQNSYGEFFPLQNEAFRTEKVIRVVLLSPQLKCMPGDDKKRQEAIESLLSSHVDLPVQFSNFFINDLRLLAGLTE